MGKQEVSPQDLNYFTLDQGLTVSMVGKGLTFPSDVNMNMSTQHKREHRHTPDTRAIHRDTHILHRP